MRFSLEINISREEMVNYLIDNGYKLEKHVVVTLVFSLDEDGQIKSEREFAIPINETFDKNKHKTAFETFKSLMQEKMKDSLLNSPKEK